MTNVRERGHPPERFCRARAFREGYEDYRLGRDPRFIHLAPRDAHYELGRQTAAFISGCGGTLRPIETRRKVPPEDFRWLMVGAASMVAETGPAFARWAARRWLQGKAAYEAIYPAATHGGDRKSDQVANLATRSFADDQAAKTGKGV